MIHPITKTCPVCGKPMGYDHEGSSEWYKCFNGCGHKEYIRKTSADFTIGDFMAIDTHTNRVMWRGTENECLRYCNDRVKLYGRLISKENNNG